MDNVTFNEPEYQRDPRSPRSSFFTNLVLKTGLAKDEKGAQTVLFIAAIAIAGIALYVFFTYGL
ncbi:MAG: hypothetical protein WAV21_02590 [Minisyncoccia bacterium]